MAHYLFSHWGNRIKDTLFEYSSFQGEIHQTQTITDPHLLGTIPLFSDPDISPLENKVRKIVNGENFFICCRGGKDDGARRYEVYSLLKTES